MPTLAATVCLHEGGRVAATWRSPRFTKANGLHKNSVSQLKLCGRRILCTHNTWDQLWSNMYHPSLFASTFSVLLLFNITLHA